MLRVTLSLSVVLTMASPELAAVPADSYLGQSANTTHAPDHILVKLDTGVERSETLGELDGSSVDGWHRVPVPEGKTPSEVVDELGSEPGVETATVDPVVQLDPGWAPVPLDHVAPVTVDDPDFALQWHLPAVQADTAWPTSTGDGVVVAVIDTGISLGGEDLDCRTLVNPYNAITGTTGAAAAADDHGHGTHVAGTVGQCTNNGVGVAGVAFDVDLMPVKVLNSGGVGVLSDVAEGIDWARTHGADVINLSLGCGCHLTMMDEAIEAAVADGLVVVAAAGNQGANSVLYPASHSDVIAVGATDFNNTRVSYSNRGDDLDVVAPGGDLDQDANTDGHPDGVLQETFDSSDVWGYYFMEGTSMATPHVSGAAALLLSMNPGIDPEVVRRALTGTSLDAGPPGFDNTYGHGLVQIHDALKFDVHKPVWTGSARLFVDTYAESSLTLSWSEATDNVAVSGYLLRMRGTTGVAQTGQRATITGLRPGTTYVFEVLARDEVGNWSVPLSAQVRTAQTFIDTAGHTFYNDILWMSGTNTTRGCNPPVNDMFCPDDSVTRGQIAAFLVRALGLKANTHPGFVDVPGGSTFVEDIGKLATAGITRGCNPPVNDRFCPDDPVTRAQAAAFLARALGLSARDHDGFVDVPVDSMYAGDIGKLATAGIARGCNPPVNDRFCPEESLLRGELGAFLHRAMD